jgi:renal tumor antigen
MHRNGIFHRDIKPENILLLNDHVKLADFGSCRGMFSEKPYTEYISTRWYRAPECLMTDGYYDHKMDVWGVGCVFFEILSLFPLFPGNNELDQIHKIHNILGTPSQRILDRFKSHASHMEFNFPTKQGTGIDKLIPNVPKDCVELIKLLLIYDPEERISASQALRHECFREFWENDRNRDFANSLTSIKLSPHGKHTQPLSSQDSLEKGANNSEYEKSSPYFHASLVKKKPKNKIGSHHNKLNLKVEGMFKSSQFNESSTEEENEKGTTLPPLKQNSILQLDSKFMNGAAGSGKQKDYGKWKIHSSVLKPTLSNQHLIHVKDKQKKNNKLLFQAPEYMIVGKKAS